MAAISHFTDIGFALDTSDQAAFGASMGALTSNCAAEPLGESGALCLIKDKSGAELRIGLKHDADGRWEVQTANPAFAGEGRTEVEIAADVSDPEYRSFETSYSARFAGERTPLVFELADPRDASAFKPGAKLAVAIAAFSYEPSVFADEAAYMKSQDKEEPKFAASFFIPSGMFFEGAAADATKRPAPQADFAGTVLKAELRTNTHGGKFWWTPVKTYGGAVFDVVMDPASLKEDPKPGSIVKGRFWLSARVAP